MTVTSLSLRTGWVRSEFMIRRSGYRLPFSFIWNHGEEDCEHEGEAHPNTTILAIVVGTFPLSEDSYTLECTYTGAATGVGPDCVRTQWPILKRPMTPACAFACGIDPLLHQTVIHLSVPNHLYRIGLRIAAWVKRQCKNGSICRANTHNLRKKCVKYGLCHV